MPNKTPSIIAGLLTFFTLIALAVLTVFMQMIALNGATENQGFNALSISLICQSVGLLIAVIIARWSTNFLIVRFKLNAVLAVIIAVVVAVGFGSLLAFLAAIISIPLAGIK